MKVRFSENVINLRGETAEEKELLDLMDKHGITVFGGGSELGICCTKHFGSASYDLECTCEVEGLTPQSPPPTTRDIEGEVILEKTEENNSITCPTCGVTEVSRDEWRNNLSKRSRTRAMWMYPYKRFGRAWVHDQYHEGIKLYKHYGVVDSVRFGRCGYQDIEIGLSLTILTEEGHGCGWTFYNIGDIAEFMGRAKAKVLSDLVGTPVIEYSTSEGLGSVVGIDVLDNLVLEK